jgi:hypothetical protein
MRSFGAQRRLVDPRALGAPKGDSAVDLSRAISLEVLVVSPRFLADSVRARRDLSHGARHAPWLRERDARERPSLLGRAAPGRSDPRRALDCPRTVSPSISSPWADSWLCEYLQRTLRRVVCAARARSAVMARAIGSSIAFHWAPSDVRARIGRK